jgi:hypothetical protein
MLSCSRTAAAASALLALACSPPPPSQIVVLVDSDIPVPARLASVRAATGAISEHVFVLGDPGTLPFSFGIAPAGGDASREVTLVVDGRDPGDATVVSRTVRTGFRPGRTLLLSIHLDAACLGVAPCGPGTTCIAGVCRNDFIEPGLLPEIEPGQELPRDAGTSDPPDAFSGTDASSETDAFVGVDAFRAADAGPTMPRSCEDVRDRGGASGVHAIDPDGAGGVPPFDVYCENAADGGGWTLIAKIDPLSTRLRYDDTT